jgi:hypothetical protein
MARQVELIVETGAVVAGANSFVTEQSIVDYALARGVVLPFTTDAEKDAVAILGILSTDYLRAQMWRGEVVSSTQPTPWPRKNLNTTTVFPENEVPYSVIEAQRQLALLSHGGTNLVPISLGTGMIVKEKIGPIENIYSEKVGVSHDGLPIFPGVLALLYPWLLGDMRGVVLVGITSVGDKYLGG